MVNTVAWGLLNDRVVDPNNKNLPFRALALRQSESDARSDEGLTLETSAF